MVDKLASLLVGQKVALSEYWSVAYSVSTRVVESGWQTVALKVEHWGWKSAGSMGLLMVAK